MRLGASAVKHLTGATQGITRMRGKWLDYNGIPVMCTFHPSYLLRNPTKKREVWEDMKTLLAQDGPARAREMTDPPIARL